ncbi:hypothetical protein, partial [Klebsiella pneumoniae]|uniref:hypothetical protein n=1 Tax=Klebsiella pneumoniae TaxID=573 RepID=UPI00405575C5
GEVKFSMEVVIPSSAILPGSINILVGIDLYPKLITGAPIETEFEGLYLMPTVFGQVVMGSAPSNGNIPAISLLAQDRGELGHMTATEKTSPSHPAATQNLP